MASLRRHTQAGIGSPSPSARRLGGARVAGLLLLSAAVAATLAIGVGRAVAAHRRATATPPAPATVPAYASAAAGGLTAQPELGFPGTAATIIGASPADGANPGGEVWAEGDAPPDAGAATPGSELLVDRPAGSESWQTVPVQVSDDTMPVTGWSTAEVTAGGAVVLAGDLKPDNATAGSGILVRAAGATRFAALGIDGVPASEPLSTAGASGTPILAADDATDGTDLFVAPAQEDAKTPNILHTTAGGPGGSGAWQSEPICDSQDDQGGCTAPTGTLTVAAISASSAATAWMVATTAAGVQLYRRTDTDRGERWLAQTIPLPTGFGLPIASGDSHDTGALITASGDGVWLDLESPDGTASATLLVGGDGSVTASWCPSTVEATCANDRGTLPDALPPGYGSEVTQAPAPAPATGSPGARVITGLPHGAMMALDAGTTSYVHRISIGGESETADGQLHADDAGGNTTGPGGETLAPDLEPGAPGQPVGGGAAFLSATDAWIGIGGPTPGPEVAHLTASPTGSALTPWPVPAQHPLFAIAGEPGADAASGTAEAIAVGADDEIQRFVPGQGWSSELLTGTPVHPVVDAPAPHPRPQASPIVGQVPTLRGVAWPNADHAYAVGDDGAMWRSESSPGIWIPDPGEPAGLTADLTAIAFSPSDPSIGYAVGKGGTLLRFTADGSWQQQALPTGLPATTDFSSVTFAGDQAIAAYRIPGASGTDASGLITADDGGDWQPASVPTPAGAVLTAVAGLPDGGAVAAGPGIVIERAGMGSWTAAPALGELSGGAVSALAAYHDAAGAVRAIVSVDPDPSENPANPASDAAQADAGSPPQPDPVPNQGFVVEQTAGGWVDEQLGDFPGVNEPAAGTPVDQPGWPEGVYALLVDPTGDGGWAVGGTTGGTQALSLSDSDADQATLAAAQDGSTARFGSGPSPPTGTGPVFANSDGSARTFASVEPAIAVGGGPGCNQPCADEAEQRPGADVDLSQAIVNAHAIAGISAFVDVGRDIGWSDPAAGTGVFARELDAYGSVLSSGPEGFPVFATPNGPGTGPQPGGDIQSTDESIFRTALGVHDPGSSVGPPPPPGTDAYASDISTPAGALRLIVLDFSQGNRLGERQEQWLTDALADAHSASEQAIVVGADDIFPDPDDERASNYAVDASTVLSELEDHAAGYVYRSAVYGNTSRGVTFSGGFLPIIGVDALGDGSEGDGGKQAGDFAIVSVLTGKDISSPGGAGQVVALTIPTLGQVSLTSAGGDSVASGQTTSFTGVGDRIAGGAGGLGTREPSIEFGNPVQDCGGAGCPIGVFSSSDPSVGQFVIEDRKNPGSPILDPDTGRPTADGYENLFCAYSPGTTTVSLNAGGVTYSRQLTVTQGDPGGPCPQPESSSTASATSTQPAPPPTPQPQPQPTPVAPHPTPHPHPAPHHPAPHHNPVAGHHHRPAPTGHHHRSAAHHGRPAHHHRPAPLTPPASAPVPTPRTAPPAAAPKSPPLSAAAPAQPVPPPGASSGVAANAPGAAGAPANAPGGAPASAPGAVPGNVAALQRRTSAEVQVEDARQHFAAYRPPHRGAAMPALGLLALALGGAGAGGSALGLRRRRRVAVSRIGRRDETSRRRRR